MSNYQPSRPSLGNTIPQGTLYRNLNLNPIVFTPPLSYQITPSVSGSNIPKPSSSIVHSSTTSNIPKPSSSSIIYSTIPTPITTTVASSTAVPTTSTVTSNIPKPSSTISRFSIVSTPIIAPITAPITSTTVSSVPRTTMTSSNIIPKPSSSIASYRTTLQNMPSLTPISLVPISQILSQNIPRPSSPTAIRPLSPVVSSIPRPSSPTIIRPSSPTIIRPSSPTIIRPLSPQIYSLLPTSPLQSPRSPPQSPRIISPLPSPRVLTASMIPKSLESPKTPNIDLYPFTSKEVCVHSEIGRRPTMEDIHLVIPITDNVKFYGVFDGHGGTDAVEWLQRNLRNILIEKIPQLINLPEPQLIQSLKDTFADIDCEMFSNYNISNPSFNNPYQHNPVMPSGTTAVAALVTPNKVYLINLGDSRGIYFKGNKLIGRTIDHKPDLESETKRIEDLGGKVTYFGIPRVMGSLAVSRALGDYMLKDIDYKTRKYGQANRCLVSPIPDVYVFDYVPGSYIFLACDGLFDVMVNSDVIEYFNNYKGNNFCKDIVKEAIYRNSGDNVTVMLISL